MQLFSKSEEYYEPITWRRRISGQIQMYVGRLHLLSKEKDKLGRIIVTILES